MKGNSDPVKNISFNFLYKIYFGILRRINSGRPELIAGDLDRILIIAPHPDDDVIGCGGIIAKNRGKKIKVIFMTDGRYGGDIYSEKELIEVRKREALEALSILGVSDVEFLGFEDGSLGEHIFEASQKLKNISQWDNIFIPNMLDNHEDHKATMLALSKALSKEKNINSNIWLYEIWTPFYPNVLIDITKEAEIKKEAINKHLSQIKCYDYSEKSLGLNSYRAISIPADYGVRFCEAFYKCSYKELINILKIIF